MIIIVRKTCTKLKKQMSVCCYWKLICRVNPFSLRQIIIKVNINLLQDKVIKNGVCHRHIINSSSFSDAPNISGLACQNNRSLSLLALDSEMYHYIAEKIGVQLLDLENKTVVLIIDNEV